MQPKSTSDKKDSAPSESPIKHSSGGEMPDADHKTKREPGDYFNEPLGDIEDQAQKTAEEDTEDDIEEIRRRARKAG